MAISDLITLGVGPGGSPSDIILMGLSPNAGGTEFTAIVLEAYLDGEWVDLSDDVLVGDGISARWGISGYSPTDIVADPGDLHFTLNNSGGEYYPDGESPLSGWGAGVKLRLVYTYGGTTYIKPLAYIPPKGGIVLQLGKVAAEDRVKVTGVDWMQFAVDAPFTEATIETDVAADDGINTILDVIPIAPAATDLDAGIQTFPAIFDSTGMSATAYSEFAKLMYAESPGYLYLRKAAANGETLTFENADARKTMTPKTIDGSEVQFVDSDIDAIELDYGGNIINYGTATAYPKRVDKDTNVLYRLPSSMPLAAEEIKEWRAKYVDPNGGGRCNAIVSSMIDPEAPGGTDTSLMLLINFEGGDADDDTGRHTVTQNDVTVNTGAYVDVGPEPDVTRIAGGVLGQYGLFGGYSAYYLSIADSDDFDFGSGAFTIGWYEALMDVTAGDAFMTRDMTASYPPWLLGYSDGSNLLIYMSSNGSSWDIANGKSLGPINKDHWTYYEVSRDSDGWFYAFRDGVLTDKWYSATAFPSSSGTVSIGRTRNTYYTFMGADSIFVRKGVCLHRQDFDPPRRNISATYEGDYLMNSAEDGTGTDLSDDLSVTVSYSSESASYTIENTGSTDGYITHLQARGLGVYPYDSIETTVQDGDSIDAYGHQILRIEQQYQQTLTAGRQWLIDIIADHIDPTTRLRKIKFWANKNANNMKRFLKCDIGDAIRVTVDRPGLDGYYYIQNIASNVHPGNLVYVEYGLVPSYALTYPGCLLHLNGDHESTDIIDKSHKAWTAEGGAYITAELGGTKAKFNECLKLDADAYITTEDHEDFFFDTGDLTIDFWIRFPDIPDALEKQIIYEQNDGAGNYIRLDISYNSGTGGQWIWLRQYIGGVSDLSIMKNSSGWITNTWYHIAIVRSGNDWMFFKNGTQVETTTTNASDLIDISAAVTVGGSSDGGNVGCYIDEFHIQKGTARWTGNFTAPTKEYGLT